MSHWTGVAGIGLRCWKRLQSSCSTGPRIAIEPLERRELLSVSLDPAGFTVVTPGKSDRVIYVSSSTGRDSNDGLSAAHPLQSLAAGIGLLRDGAGDQLLLRRGDTWHDSIDAFYKSGRSASEPMVIGAYGDGDRPTIATSGGSAFATNARNGGVEHLAVLGIRFTASARDPDSPDYRPASAATRGIGVNLFAGGRDLLLEDCAISDFATNLTVQHGIRSWSDVTLRRNVITDAYATDDGHAQGFFADGVSGLTIEENVFDHNGWNEKVSGAVPTTYNHNLYITTDTSGVVVKGNIIANAASHGLQARSGGDIEDNLFINNPIGMSYGLVRGDSPPVAGGVSGIVNGNVFVGWRDINGQGRGVGIEVANLKPFGPTVISNNIFSGVGMADPSSSLWAIQLGYGEGLNNDTLAAGLNDLTVQGNVVYRWEAGLMIESKLRPGDDGAMGIRRLTVKKNDFSEIVGSAVSHNAPFGAADERWTGNHYDSDADSRTMSLQGRTMSVSDWIDRTGATDAGSKPKFAAPQRTPDAYLVSVGGSGKFVAAARKQSERAWNASVTAAGFAAFARDGFADPTPGATPRSWQAPTPPIATADMPASVTTDESALRFTVSWRDDTGIDVSTIDGGDVYLTHNGKRMDVTLVSVTSPDERTAVATYELHAPKAVWRRKDRGSYRLVIADEQVRDVDGFWTDSQTIGTADLDVVQLPPPVTIKKLKFSRGKRTVPDRLTMTFSRDLQTPPAVTDLRLTDSVSGETLDVSGAAFTYDAVKRQAIWDLTNFTDSRLPRGTYTVTLAATGVMTDDGKHLDGNADGIGGDDFAYRKTLRIK